MGEEGTLYTCLCLWPHPGKRSDPTQLHKDLSLCSAQFRGMAQGAASALGSQHDGTRGGLTVHL